MSEKAVAEVVGATEGFSFAYLKELFIASMVQWVSEGRSKSMDQILLGQTDMLREQMKIKKRKSKKG